MTATVFDIGPLIAALNGNDSHHAASVRFLSGVKGRRLDASVIAVAERHGVGQVATLDHRHFRAIKPRHVAALDLVP